MEDTVAPSPAISEVEDDNIGYGPRGAVTGIPPVS